MTFECDGDKVLFQASASRALDMFLLIESVFLSSRFVFEGIRINQRVLGSMMIITIILLFQFIQLISTIECYVCTQSYDYHCSLPLDLESWDESSENEIRTSNYDSGYACVSDHSFNPRTGEERIIVRGIDHCVKLNIPNRRVHCCYTNKCNNQFPPMIVKTSIDLISDERDVDSAGHQHFASLMLTNFLVIFMRDLFFD